MNAEVFIIVYNLTTLVKFIMFYRDYDKFCDLMKAISGKFKDSFVAEARKAEKIMKIIANLTVLNLIIACALYSFKWSTNPFELAHNMLTGLSGFYNDFTNTMLQLVFLNFSIQICTLYRQLQSDLEAIQPTQNADQTRKSVSEVVEMHQDILEIVEKTVKLFRMILSFSFIISIGFIGQTLILSTDSNWEMFLLTTPYLLFEAWIFCYSSQKIITKVRKKVVDEKLKVHFFFQANELSNSIYFLPWYDFEKNSSKKLLSLLMMKFQRPVKIVMFKVMNFDLELFVFVSF